MNKFKIINKVAALFLLAVPMVTFTSCDDSFIYEDQGDCKPHYYIDFEYTLNLKWADAFASEVKAVNVYAFDKDDVFVAKFSAEGEALQAPGYRLYLDLNPEEYHFVAWCYGTQYDRNIEYYKVPELTPGVSKMTDLTNALNTIRNTRSEENYSDELLQFLFWGELNAVLDPEAEGDTYVGTISLTKDTNNIHIILQQLDGTEMDEDDYEFTIEVANGVLGYDNALLGSQTITYLPWNQIGVNMGIGDDDGQILNNRGVKADLSVSRFTADMASERILTITKAETNEVIARVPMLEYALMELPYYERAYGYKMDPQEFLDRKDEYEMTFFLKGTTWSQIQINVLEWRIVIDNYDVD